MKDTLISAKLIDWQKIRLTLFYDTPIYEVRAILGNEDDGTRLPLSQSKASSTTSLSVYDYKLPAPLELGHSYFVEVVGFGRYPLDVNDCASFEGFDEKYRYDGPLGAIYAKEETRFVLFAPLASRVTLLYSLPKAKEWHLVPMKRLHGGIYEIRVKGDLKNARYFYSVRNSGVENRCIDPYALSSGPNGSYSYVVDIEGLRTKKDRAALPAIQSPTEAIIYELSVRDMTAHPGTDIKHKGLFLGLAEKGKKTAGGLPAGLDYLKSLGITHAQILPMYDFASVDEKKKGEGYNWGYDPAQYFVPEGSYCTDPDDPEKRLLECEKMIDAVHEEGIRVVMDVVYNHVYSFEASNFEKLVPGYYFRHTRSGRMASTSGCGNDLASERPMVRRLIIDSALHWVDFYDVDGFRFDLMGIIDVETLKQIETEVRKRKKNFLLYGEGWNMGGEVDFPLGQMGNCRLLPTYAFFNDRYREAIKGLLFGDESKKPLAMHCLAGSSNEFNAPPLFMNAAQSLNYVECHDNGTFYDYVKRLRPYLKEEEVLSLVKLAVAFVLFSFGIPFIHAGQEIGGTKKGIENSYNSPVEINWFDYSLLEARKDLYEFAKQAIAIRRKKRFFHLYDPSLIYNLIDVTDRGGAIFLRDNDSNAVAPDRRLELYLNVEPIDVEIEVGEGALILLDAHGGAGEGLPAGKAKVPAFSPLLLAYK